MTIGTPVFYPASAPAIRDATFARLQTVPGLANVYKARTMPGQDDQFPYAAVWLARERTVAWGANNVGDPTFEHTLTLAIDVLAKAGDEATLDTDIVALVLLIQTTLLTDPTWVQLFEGIEGCSANYSYPKEAADIAVQAVIEIELSFKSEWPPAVPNALQTVAVTAQPVPASWTCRYCGTVNPGSSPACSVCSAAAPIATPVFSQINLEG